MKSRLRVTQPMPLLMAEGLSVLLASSAAFYLLFPHHWVLFLCLFLVPDLSLLPYLRGPSEVASAFYNPVHSYVLPVMLGVFAVPAHNALLGEIGLIWIAHIGMDRMFGYGLKYPSSFRFTHIQSTDTPAVVPIDSNAQ